MKKILLTFALAVLCTAVAGQSASCSGSYSAAATNDGINWNVAWTVSADFYSIAFTVTARTEGWVAIGFSRDQVMPNTDIVVGAADGAGNSYVSDRFATAQAAPPVDSSQDIFQIGAEQMDTGEGTYTIVNFTRPICSTDQFDYSLDEDLYILYAWGMERNFDGSDPMSIMQHGGGTANRGYSASPISFVCKACHRCYSAADTIPGVRWNAGWYVSPDSQYVSFAVAALTDGWVAIGFSMDRMMPATDIIVGAVDNTGTSPSYVSDRYASMRAAPAVDAVQNIMDSNAVQIDIGGNIWTVVTFTRPVSANNADDLGLNVPVFFLYAWGMENNFDPNDPMSINMHTMGVTTSRGASAKPITVLCPACSGHYSAAATSDGVMWTVYWYVSADFYSIVFTVIAKTEGWVAIGFSRDQAMPNTDIIVGAADGAGNSYVSDRFADDRAAPLVDDSQDIFQTNAQQIVTSEGNYTIVIFARPICSTDQYDISLNEDLYILYAWGIERNFDGSDAMSIMQHGMGDANRGFSASQKSFVCACHRCYSAADTIPGVRWNAGWSVSADSQYVSFAVAAQTNGWVAIGFSMDRMMSATDIIVGAVDDTGTSPSYVSDRYASAQAAPDVDAEQDIMNSNADQIDIGGNTWTVVTFTRPVSANNVDDRALNMIPLYLLYAWGTNNNFNPSDRMSINRHGNGVTTARGASAMPITIICPVPNPTPSPVNVVITPSPNAGGAEASIATAMVLILALIALVATLF